MWRLDDWRSLFQSADSSSSISCIAKLQRDARQISAWKIEVRVGPIFSPKNEYKNLALIFQGLGHANPTSTGNHHGGNESEMAMISADARFCTSNVQNARGTLRPRTCHSNSNGGQPPPVDDGFLARSKVPDSADVGRSQDTKASDVVQCHDDSDGRRTLASSDDDSGTNRITTTDDSGGRRTPHRQTTAFTCGEMDESRLTASATSSSAANLPDTHRNLNSGTKPVDSTE
ncbi:hypothetical protein IWX47DRAFT_926312 [Phyllosticta citricarpa]